jgi:hypothetical protein
VKRLEMELQASEARRDIALRVVGEEVLSKKVGLLSDEKESSRTEIMSSPSSSF